MIFDYCRPTAAMMLPSVLIICCAIFLVFLPRDATESAVMLQYIVCPSLSLSVRLSVMFRYRDDIGLNSSKVILWPNSLSLKRGLTPTWAIWCNGNTPEIRVE